MPWFLFVLAMLLSVSVEARHLSVPGNSHHSTVYVDNTATCPGSGTSAAPYCTIQNAINAASAGYDIRIRFGTGVYDATNAVSLSGAAGNPIIIESDNLTSKPILRETVNPGANNPTFDIWSNIHDWTFRNLVFDGTGVFTSNMAIWAESNNARIAIQSNTFKNWGGTEANVTTGCGGGHCTGVGALDANGLNTGSVVSNNLFDGNRQQDIGINNQNAIVIYSGNEFRNEKCGWASDGSATTLAFHIIATAGTPQLSVPIIIAHNIFHDFQPSAGTGACGLSAPAYIVISPIWADVGPTGGTIDSNLIYNINQANPSFSSPGIGIFLEADTQGWVIKNNVVHDIGGAGIEHSAGDGNLGVNLTDYNYYYNNTVYNTGGAGIWLKTGWATVKNNVVEVSGTAQTYGIRFENSVGGSLVIDYNEYWGYSSNTQIALYSGAADATFASWKTSCSCDSHSINLDPIFVSTVTPDFHLQSSSPARDVGTTISSVAVDYDGISRPQGSAYDMGAYEYH